MEMDMIRYSKDAATQEDMFSLIAAETEATQPRTGVDGHVRESSLVLRVRAGIRKVLGDGVNEVKIIATGGVIELYGVLDSETLIEEAVSAARAVRGAQIVI